MSRVLSNSCDPRDSLQARLNNSSHDLSLFGGVSLPLTTARFELKGKYFKRSAGIPGPIFQLTPLAKSDGIERELYSIFEKSLGASWALSAIGGISDRDISYDSPQTPTNFVAYKTRFKEGGRDIKLGLTDGNLIDAYISRRYETLDGNDYIRPTSSFGRHSRSINAVGVGTVVPIPGFASFIKITTLNLGLKRESGSGGIFWGPSGG